MSKTPYCEPNQLTIPASGGQIKFRLKNPDTKKFLYQLEISDPNTYTVDVVPLGILPMGENKLVEITKKAGGADGKLVFKYYPPPSNPQDFVIPETPLGTFECKIVSK